MDQNCFLRFNHCLMSITHSTRPSYKFFVCIGYSIMCFLCPVLLFLAMSMSSSCYVMSLLHSAVTNNLCLMMWCRSVLLFHHYVMLFDHYTISSLRYTISSLYYFIIILFHHYTILSLYYFIIILFHHYTISSLYYFIIILFYHYTISSLYYFVFILFCLYTISSLYYFIIILFYLYTISSLYYFIIILSNSTNYKEKWFQRHFILVKAFELFENGHPIQ